MRLHETCWAQKVRQIYKMLKLQLYSGIKKFHGNSSLFKHEVVNFSLLKKKYNLHSNSLKSLKTFMT